MTDTIVDKQVMGNGSSEHSELGKASSISCPVEFAW